ncbi:unnamed protein product [Calypogeia fissa]
MQIKLPLIRSVERRRSCKLYPERYPDLRLPVIDVWEHFASSNSTDLFANSNKINLDLVLVYLTKDQSRCMQRI